MARFCAPDRQQVEAQWEERAKGAPVPKGTPAEPSTRTLPGPTGESNRLTLLARPPLLCAGPGEDTVAAQVQAVTSLGGTALAATGAMTPDQIAAQGGISGVLWWGDEETARAIDLALAGRDGPIVPLIPGKPDLTRVRAERHLCIDTTAAGGNAALLGGAA